METVPNLFLDSTKASLLVLFQSLLDWDWDLFNFAWWSSLFNFTFSFMWHWLVFKVTAAAEKYKWRFCFLFKFFCSWAQTLCGCYMYGLTHKLNAVTLLHLFRGDNRCISYLGKILCQGLQIHRKIMFLTPTKLLSHSRSNPVHLSRSVWQNAV